MVWQAILVLVINLLFAGPLEEILLGICIGLLFMPLMAWAAVKLFPPFEPNKEERIRHKRKSSVYLISIAKIICSCYNLAMDNKEKTFRAEIFDIAREWNETAFVDYFEKRGSISTIVNETLIQMFVADYNRHSPKAILMILAHQILCNGFISEDQLLPDWYLP